jgi:hypothetical protein
MPNPQVATIASSSSAATSVVVAFGTTHQSQNLAHWRRLMSPNNPFNNPSGNPEGPEGQDFETLLQNALGIKLAKVKQSSIKYMASKEFPNTRVIKRTTVISVIEKRGQLSNLSQVRGSN